MCLFLGLGGCVFSGKGDERTADGRGQAQVRLVLARAALARSAAGATAPFDSVHVRVSADDMAPMDFSFRGDSLAFDLGGLPAGSERIVTAHLFRAGRALYSGTGVFALRRESKAEAALRCDPLFSRVTAMFHLPLGMPAPVASGRLTLIGGSGTFSADMRLIGEFASFSVDEVPGDLRYDAEMDLMDSLGRVAYRAERSGVFLPLGEEARWDLSLLPTAAAAGLSLSLGDAVETRLSAGFPSRKRRPSRPGEIILSEFYAAPGERDSSSQGEWWELFNRSQDTLQLGGCRVSRDRGSGATRSYAFDSARALGPGRALVFGRAAATADVHYEDFSLVNTSSSLLVLCSGDSLLVDSLRYSSAASDSSALPIRDGLVTTLDAAAIGRREVPAGWCLSGNGTASPGRVDVCR